MEHVSRRSFIVNVATLATLHPIIQTLSGCRTGQAYLSLDSAQALRVLSDNGQNLAFFFINVKSNGKLITAEDEVFDSFMIVQFPPQSMHEEYVSAGVPAAQVNAKLARHSYLAFQLWPGLTGSARKLDMKPQALLNWKDEKFFRLLTTANAKPESFKKFSSKEQVADVLVDMANDDVSALGIDYYLKVLAKIFNRSAHGDQYISLFELPAELYMVPHIGQPNMEAQVIQNDYKISTVEYEFTQNGMKVRRVVRERWNMELKFLQKEVRQDHVVTSEMPPVLRAIALRTANFQPTTRPEDECTIFLDGQKYLPTLLDKLELIFLNQVYNSTYSGADYDIKIKSKCLFTATGASLKFHYKNYISGHPKISLVEYEHHFQDGRDNYIKIARIGVLAPYGHKALHVKIARRKVSLKGIAYMELKHYVEIIQPSIDFPVTKADFGQPNLVYATMFDAVADDFEENRKATYYNRHPFRQSISLVERTQPIEPPSDCTLSFWVYREGAANEAFENLISLPFRCLDRNEKTLNTQHPVLFLRKDFFATPSQINPFLGAGVPANAFLSAKDDGRLKIPFSNQVVAFTPDDPEALADEEIKNKINQLPTDYLEYYINIAQPLAGTAARDLFDTVPHIIFLQVRRAKVMVEQIQQYSREKLPSVVTYPIDYLENDFNRQTNKAKLVLKHTKDFVEGQLKNLKGEVIAVGAIERDLANGYQRIRDVFTRAEDRIGGLVNPDVQVERFALVKEAMTLPKNVNQQWEKFSDKSQRLLNTAEILKGKSAEILGGIDLKMLLEEVLGVEETPQFQLNKIAGTIQNIDKFLNEFKNPVVVKVLDAVRSMDRVINGAMAEVNNVLSELRTYEEALTEARSKLHATLEDVSHIRNAAKLLYEQQRLQFIDAIDSTAARVEDHLRNEVASEVSKITGIVDKADTVVADEINRLIDYSVVQTAGLIPLLIRFNNSLPKNERDYVANILNLLSVDGRQLLEQYKTTGRQILQNAALTAGTYKYSDSRDYFNNQAQCYEQDGRYYIKFAADASKKRVRWDEVKWPNLMLNGSDLSNLNLFGLYQLQQLELYIQAVSPGDVSRFRSRITTLQNELNNSAYAVANKVYDALQLNYTRLGAYVTSELKSGLDTALKLVDLVRKSTTKFYVDRYVSLKRDYEDVRKKLKYIERVLPSLKELRDNPADFFRLAAQEYNEELRSYGTQLLADNFDRAQVQTQVNRMNAKVEHFSLLLDNAIQKAVEAYINTYPEAAQANNILKEIRRNQELLEHPERGLKRILKEKESYYKAQIELQAKGMFEQLEKRFRDEVSKLTRAEEVRAAKREYDHLLALLASVRKQEMNYTWSTDKFKKANVGILRFTPDTNPKTKLTVAVKNTIYLDPLRLPPVIEKLDASAVNTLTNFNITFLNVITVGFTQIQFVTGTSSSANLTVKIRDVKFDGALSFIQKLEDLLKSLGEGFKVEIRPTGVGIGYVMPVPAVSSPGFTFSNITIGVFLNIYFDRQPMTLKFMLAKPDNKAIVAAGILGGGFNCTLTAEPRRGIRHIQMALEMGAYLGLSIGPIRGEVKLMVGLSYEKDDYGVTMEGYIIALGRLSVWIINVTAKIVLYVRSQGSYVEGACTVTYSAKLGFIEKSFSGTFRKKLAGAKKSGQASRLRKSIVLKEVTRNLYLLPASVPASHGFSIAAEDYFDDPQYRVMHKSEWTNFYQNFFQ